MLPLFYLNLFLIFFSNIIPYSSCTTVPDALTTSVKNISRRPPLPTVKKSLNPLKFAKALDLSDYTIIYYDSLMNPLLIDGQYASSNIPFSQKTIDYLSMNTNIEHLVINIAIRNLGTWKIVFICRADINEKFLKISENLFTHESFIERFACKETLINKSKQFFKFSPQKIFLSDLIKPFSSESKYILIDRDMDPILWNYQICTLHSNSFSDLEKILSNEIGFMSTLYAIVLIVADSLIVLREYTRNDFVTPFVRNRNFIPFRMETSLNHFISRHTEKIDDVDTFFTYIDGDIESVSEDDGKDCSEEESNSEDEGEKESDDEDDDKEDDENECDSDCDCQKLGDEDDEDQEEDVCDEGETSIAHQNSDSFAINLQQSLQEGCNSGTSDHEKYDDNFFNSISRLYDDLLEEDKNIGKQYNNSCTF